MARTYLVSELVIVFLLPPLILWLGLLPKYMVMPCLWAVSVYTFITLRRNQIPIFTSEIDKQQLIDIFIRFVLVVSFLALFTWWQYPELLFDLTSKKPWLWGLVMLLYPLLSVIPQEIAFRRFFFYRYEPLFGGRTAAVAVNAVVFSYVHIVFGNVIALVFTLVGSLLFAHTYLQNRSVLMVSIEHALYGNAIYTLGLGMFFYHNGSHVG